MRSVKGRATSKPMKLIEIDSCVKMRICIWAAMLMCFKTVLKQAIAQNNNKPRIAPSPHYEFNSEPNRTMGRRLG